MKTTSTIVTTLIVLLLCCLCVACASFGVFALGAYTARNAPSAAAPTQPAVEILRPPEPPGDETLLTLASTIVPQNNPADLAVRLGGVTVPIPDTVPLSGAPALGDQYTFWASNTDTTDHFQVPATLQYITPHTYFWIENGVPFDPDELAALAKDFESHTYPTVRAFFGSEWTPGIDADPHLHILYARGLGGGIAGYFSSADEMHPLVHEYSNAREMFFLNADNTELDDLFTYGVLAHEFQHMIHWHGDRNENTWMNEGFSEVAALLTGYYEGNFDTAYVSDPDLQLNDWPADGDKTPHYGGAFLFLTYFLERYGETATRQLVNHPRNGFESIDVILAELGAADPLWGDAPSADDLFQDFSLALYLQDQTAGDGRYSYPAYYPAAPNTGATETVRNCPAGRQARDVAQYGIDYIRITCTGSYTLRFEGSTSIPVVSLNPHSGDYAFWSNRGDESDMTLTRLFDFTDRTGALTLTYWMWHDLEADYDYVYLLASTDGETWQIIRAPRSTDDDPSGNSFGWAYNGHTGGWVQETVDISRFAGGQVWLRFEYITDAAVNGEGFLLDDIAIAEAGYAEGFEAGDGGWEAAGFARIHNALPQTYRVAVITFTSSGATVEYVALAADNTADITFSIGGEVREIVLVVSGTTRFTTQRTGYAFEVMP
jgi:hypothetical protein